MKDIKINDFTVGREYKPFVIAEMSGNHNHSLSRALEIVDKAAECGCHALKIQTYRADTITIDVKRDEFFIEDKTSLWKGQYLYELYEKAFTPWEWHKPIFDRCQKKGLIAFSSPFDETAVDFLEELDVPVYKIASFENNHLPLIKKVAALGKPIMMSTGMATIEELHESLSIAREAGCENIILLKCTSAYPSEPKDANLLTLPDLQDRFNCQVGLSDHTLGIGVAIASIALGARVVEKHFTLDRSAGGVDAAFSMEPDEMKALVEETQRAFLALGSVNYDPTENEKKNMRFRRSIFVTKDINKGETLSRENIKVIRPGDGLAPRYFEQVLGKKASADIIKGTPLNWALVLEKDAKS